ncbi:DNA-binding protein [Chryseobacterium sp. CBo1]|uniref:Zn-ribbon-containing protein n=1 Tax=Chryseobacterium sp. CBo1 TaxID=1869230 RepID=UPI000810AD04|nr:Zn-ribbon-containing protein [Chryseobacterium sp. CBo1]OCK51290.1 DNA-binding protein [Chryseobacterium sp. CBo1]
MYIQEISIDIKTKTDKDKLVDEFGLLMSFYRGNGQTQGRIESQYIENDKIVCLPFTLEKNSLDKKLNNFYVNRQSEKIEKLCNSKLTFKTVGKSYDSYKTPCKCKKSDFYILITNYVTIESPLTCGTCNKSVPLYLLPAYYDFGYMPILSWETNYISCDSLQMNCEVGERWALNQMQEITSQLSKQGVGICRKIEELTSIPTYYYLHNYKKSKGDQLTRPCPSCSKKWDLKTQLHNLYDFKCDKCKIVSTISPNS